jgi:hypothetical protein
MESRVDEAPPDDAPGGGYWGARARVVARALELTDAERAFMAALVPFAASTPRRVLRFLNVYRVIKASLEAEELDRLEDGGYRSLMTQLAIATEAPALHRDWLGVLSEVPKGDNLQDMQSHLRTALDEVIWLAPQQEQSQLAKALDLFLSRALPAEAPSTEAAITKRGLELLEAHGDIARRYSFSDGEGQ